MSINYLSAQHQDCIQIANWINEIGHGHIEYLLDGLVPGRSSMQQLAVVLQQDDHYSYKNVELAKDGDQIIGLMFSYNAVANAITPEMQRILSQDRIQWMRYFSGNQINNSWYINTLGVTEEYRRQGIAKRLLDNASQRALKNGLQCLCLHVYENNAAAINLYESYGFAKEKRMALEGHPFFKDRDLSANYLMKFNLPE